MMKEYKSPLDIHVGPTDGELGVTLRMRKDGSICIMAIDPALCPVLHRAAVDGILRILGAPPSNNIIGKALYLSSQAGAWVFRPEPYSGTT